jgi:arsenate reductase
MSLVLYGVRSCDTVGAARRWLETHGVAFRFHDYRDLGLERSRLDAWVEEVGVEVLLNRKGTTFRKLDPAVRASLDEAGAVEAMAREVLLIKRPVLEGASSLLVGFSPERYEAALAVRPRRG